MRKLKFGEILIEEKLITRDQLNEALERQKVVRKRLGEILVDMRVISEKDMLTTLASKLNFQYVDNLSSHLDHSLNNMVPREFALQKKILPLYIEEGTLFFATSDPLDFVTMEDLSMIAGFDTLPIITLSRNVEQGINALYAISQEGDLSLNDTDYSEAALMERVDSAPIVKMVNGLILSAFNENASDIHIEPEQNLTRVRFRIDGTLHEHTTLKSGLHDLVTTRIKIIAGMNIAEKRKPLDGAFRHQMDYDEVDIRVSSIPTPLGEKLVLRILGADKNISYDLDSIDISKENKEKLKTIAQVPHGILLLTGPTGSGKTTTLYSLLHEISSDEISVVTVEDPVEKSFEGITQVQINAKAGLTFANSLRSILRQDPDVIMVGEIRDAETATIAIRAAITGHFVLSTLHTNDALSSVTRLVDMGVESYMVASSLKAVIAQRLVRKVCPHCAIKTELSADDKLLINDTDLTHAMKGGGCERCNQSGYIGRRAVFEIIFIDETLQDLIASNASMHVLKDYAISQGTQFLRDDVIRLIKEGVTSVDEARKILFSVN